MVDSQDRDDCFYGATGTEQVTQGRFRGSQYGPRPERPTNCLCFRDVPHDCACGVAIHMVDLIASHACLPQGLFDGTDLPEAFRVRTCDVEGIGRNTGTLKYAADFRAPSFGMISSFKDKDSGAFPENEAIAVGIEWSRCCLRIPRPLGTTPLSGQRQQVWTA
jgi:hypothetical protein